MEIKLTLSLDEVNGIISTLGMLPFNQSAGIIQKVREQAIPQVQEHEAAVKLAAEAANDNPTA